MADRELVVIRSFPDRIEADLAASALHAAGIEAMIRADDAGGLQPALWEGEGIDLMVHAADAGRAREILDTAALPADEE